MDALQVILQAQHCQKIRPWVWFQYNNSPIILDEWPLRLQWDGQCGRPSAQDTVRAPSVWLLDDRDYSHFTHNTFIIFYTWDFWKGFASLLMFFTITKPATFMVQIRKRKPRLAEARDCMFLVLDVPPIPYLPVCQHHHRGVSWSRGESRFPSSRRHLWSGSMLLV